MSHASTQMSTTMAIHTLNAGCTWPYTKEPYNTHGTTKVAFDAFNSYRNEFHFGKHMPDITKIYLMAISHAGIYFRCNPESVEDQFIMEYTKVVFDNHLDNVLQWVVLTHAFHCNVSTFTPQPARKQCPIPKLGELTLFEFLCRTVSIPHKPLTDKQLENEHDRDYAKYSLEWFGQFKAFGPTLATFYPLLC